MSNDAPNPVAGLQTREEFAASVKRSTATIRRWEAMGLPVHKRGNLRLYDTEESRAWLRGELPAPAPRKPGRPKSVA
jgi:hypothetical protein